MVYNRGIEISEQHSQKKAMAEYRILKVMTNQEDQD